MNNDNSAALQGKTILLVHAGSMRKKFIFERLKELGARIVCLNKAKTELAEVYVDEWIIADLKDSDTCVEKVKQFNADNPAVKIDGAVTFWDECILLTSQITDALDLPGIPASVSDRIKNKYVFRNACEAEGIVAPCHRLIRSEADLVTIDQVLEYPLVIKPIYGACSAFVVRVENHDELLAAYVTIKQNIHTFWLAPEWSNLEVLVEEYIEGQEVDIDILLQNGAVKYLSIVDNKKTNEPFFVETGWSSPSQLSLKEQDELRRMALGTLEKLGVKNGCIHFEAKVGPQGAVTIEVNLRMGGGEVYLYSKLVWEVDLVANAASIALGIPISVQKPNRPLRYLLSHRFLSNESCAVIKTEINATLKEQPYFVDMYFEKEPGEIFLAPPKGYDRSIGVITVSGGSHEEAADNLVKALRYVHYEVKSIDATNFIDTKKLETGQIVSS